MRLHVDRVGTVTTGYGQMGLGLARGLESLGHECVDEDAHAGLRVVCAPPYALRSKPVGQELWVYTMFESTRLPESFLEHIDNFAGVLVPNDYNLEQFSAEHTNVHKVPIGIDPNVWFPVRRNIDKELRFLHLGKGLRKGADIVERMFNLAFPAPQDMDPVPVLARSPVGGRLTESEVVDLYHTSHVYLAPSRGEGWNLLAFQGLATGMPTILTDIPGHAGFSGLPGAYKVPWSLSKSVIGGATNWWAGYWWDPKIDDFVDQMRYVYNNYRRCENEAKVGGFEIWKNMTWRQMGVDFLEAVGDYERPQAGPEMENAHSRIFEVEVTRPVVNADIAGNILNLEPGKHFITADQMRVLQTAGYAAGTSVWMHDWENDRRKDA